MPFEPVDGVYVGKDELVALRSAARHTTLLPRQPVRSLLAGRRASKLRGRGLDFDELRAYVAGDDVRRIDWRATARLGRPYVRTYTQERDRPVLLVVDQRPSMFFGSRAMKSVVAARLAALAAWRVVAVGDQVGAIVLGERELWTLRPGHSPAVVLQLIERLVSAGRLLGKPPRAPLDTFEGAMNAVGRLAPHDALVVVISDLRGLSNTAETALSHVRRRADLIVAWVIDPLEAALPDVGRAAVSDGAEQLSLPTSDPALRAAFASAFANDRARVRSFCDHVGALQFELGTERSVVEQVESTFGKQRLASGRHL